MTLNPKRDLAAAGQAEKLAALNRTKVIATAALVLCVGIFALFRGGRFNRSYSNLLMRWRILLQFIVICLIAVASFAFRS